MANHVKDMTIRDTDWSTVPAVALANVLRAVEGCVPVRAVCSDVGLDVTRATEPDARVPYHQLADLYEAAARWTGDPWFGLHVGANVDARRFDLLGYLALTTATLEQAFEVLARYLPLWTTSAGFQIERSRTTIEVAWAYADPTAPLRRHDCEMSMMAAVNVGGQLHAGRWRPREVHFRHGPPADTSEHARLLRAPVRFGMPRNLIVCDAASGATPIASADPVLHELLRDLAERRLAGRAVQPSILDDIVAAIVKLLPTGDVQLPRVARTLGLGARTLQRRLIASGATFRSLLATVRRDRAMHALVHSDLPIGEIATRLGYGSLSEFHRAFRSWVGVGPAAYRRAHRARR
ncbi:transcriptional regulator, AraC family [Sorangium cellulosum So ce56]|uniref:Transcriptional regulator, AraC family n=1 Tax=Sorangium cellulosum (strain So ce56) TaxID=448385 RepID=A9GK31_SORC5|nr:AraC family transcriptional regulator [Sorangium cellulosum]CAN96524.1 transcriptional regulator, AraC family [Sorangium cellulosum So ce56]